MNGIESIAAERKRQIEEEDWALEHDDDHDAGEMAKAGSCYAWISAQTPTIREAFSNSAPPVWPDEWGIDWWKPTTPRQDLVKAGALIAAEIDRLDRLEAKKVAGA